MVNFSIMMVTILKEIGIKIKSKDRGLFYTTPLEKNMSENIIITNKMAGEPIFLPMVMFTQDNSKITRNTVLDKFLIYRDPP